jgi:hypothetical protein
VTFFLVLRGDFVYNRHEIMSFAELLAEVKNLSPSEKEALRSFLAGDLLNQEESEEFLTQLDSDDAHADAGNKVYTIKEIREMVKSVVARAGR